MGPRRGSGTTVAMRDARCGGGRQLIRREGMHVGRQRRRLASLGPERRVDFYPENPPTAGSLVSNYRNAVALGHSCLASLSFAPSASLPPNLYDHLCKCVLIYRTNVFFIDFEWRYYAQENYFTSNLFNCIAQLQSIWMEEAEGRCTLVTSISKYPDLKI